MFPIRLSRGRFSCPRPVSRLILTCLASALAITASSQPLLSQTDPEYDDGVLRNTICSFIVTEDVDGRVAVRQSPSTSAPVILRLPRGAGVRALGRQGNWVQVAALAQGTPPRETFRPMYGWVFNRYINGCSEDQFDRWRR
jgi:hypothetical protein